MSSWCGSDRGGMCLERRCARRVRCLAAWTGERGTVDRSRSKRHGEMQREQRRRDRGDEAWSARLGSVPTLHSRVRLERRKSTAMCAVRGVRRETEIWVRAPFRFVELCVSQKKLKRQKVQKKRLLYGFISTAPASAATHSRTALHTCAPRGGG